MIKKLPLVLLLLCSFFLGFGQSIFENPITDQNPSNANPYTNGQIVDPNITVSGIGRGSGINANNGQNRYNASNWDSTVFDSNDYFEFVITPSAGYEINFVSFEYTAEVSNRGPINFAFRSSVDSFANNIGTPLADGTTITIDLTSLSYQNINTSVTFRYYSWGAVKTNGSPNPNGTFSINDFVFNGIVSTFPTCVTTTIWNGLSWDTGIPNINTIAIIDGNYDTSIGSFESCELTINAGNNLIISNNTYIKIQNSIIVYGNIILETQGSFVQVDDSGTFTVKPGGSSSVIKQTANLNDWYEYTYWSSPVVGETVEGAFPETPSNRRFWYNGQNFLDQTREIGNNNAALPGQDDIDDNGDDWQIASGIMKTGLGYAATSSPLGIYPNTDIATFSGDFNTGDITIDVYKNDLEANDNNWNLIGNPYPSAIDADLFLAANTVVDQNVPVSPSFGVTDGAIFFWSQDSSASNSNNGNENLNFSQSDYAIINSVTQVAGGDGLIPTRHIPSGQAFFIVYDHNAPEIDAVGSIKRNVIRFTNSMRIADTTSNSQFFKSPNNEENRLWVDLTSDNGVFSQIAVAYVSGATHKDDGAGYDTERNLSLQRFATIYTKIKGKKDKQYVIQAKSSSGLTKKEVIHLGLKTDISTPTLYKFSIPKYEGSFFETNTIYLKDKLLNTLHSLKDSDYVFTSEVGEFNDRFEIVFRKKGKPTGRVNKNAVNNLKIIELQNGNIKFALSGSNEFKNILILDLQGKIIYNLKANGNSNVFNLSNLRQTIYIAKVELSDGSIINQKLIKRQ